MDFRDSWLYSDFIHPNLQVPLVQKGVPPEKLKEIVAGWRQMADMYRIKAVGLERVLEELIRQGKITREISRTLAVKHVRNVAKEEGFNLDAAQAKFPGKK